MFNATPMGMEDGDPLPVVAVLLTPSVFVGDVIAGHGVTPFIKAAQAVGCKTANGGRMVEAGLAFLQPQVPVRAHADEHGDLFAAQPGTRGSRRRAAGQGCPG